MGSRTKLQRWISVRNMDGLSKTIGGEVDYIGTGIGRWVDNGCDTLWKIIFVCPVFAMSSAESEDGEERLEA